MSLVWPLPGIPSGHNPPVFPGATYHACHCEPVRRLVWQSPRYSESHRKTHVIARRPAADVAIRNPSLLLRGVVLRAANQNYNDCRWQSYHNVQVPGGRMRSLHVFALIRLALAGDARATFPGGEGRGYGLPHQSADWFAMTTYFLGFLDSFHSRPKRDRNTALSQKTNLFQHIARSYLHGTHLSGKF